MNSIAALQSRWHCKYKISLHIIFTTEQRKPILSPKILEQIQDIFQGLCQNRQACLVKFQGDVNYVHLLVDIPPDLAVAKLVNTLKTISSRKLRKEYRAHLESMQCQGFWQPSYCVISESGASEEVIQSYLVR